MGFIVDLESRVWVSMSKRDSFSGWAWVELDRQAPPVGWHGWARPSAMLGSAPYNQPWRRSIEKFV